MSAAAPRRMNLGVFAVGNGNHVAGWRHPGAAKSGDDIRSHIDIGQRAEAPRDGPDVPWPAGCIVPPLTSPRRGTTSPRACRRRCARRLVREACSGTTLRDHLGLPVPADRYARDS